MKTWTQEVQVICYQEEGPKIESKTPGQEACIPWLPCCSSTPATQLHINQERGRCRNHAVLTAQGRCSGAWAREEGRLYNLSESWVTIQNKGESSDDGGLKKTVWRLSLDNKGLNMTLKCSQVHGNHCSWVHTPVLRKVLSTSWLASAIQLLTRSGGSGCQWLIDVSGQHLTQRACWTTDCQASPPELLIPQA